MNLLYYLRVFPKLSESFVLNEIYELSRAGHNVAVCSVYEPTEEPTHQELTDLDVPVQYIEPPTPKRLVSILTGDVICHEVLSQARYRATLRQHLGNLYRADRCIRFVDSLDWEIDHLHTHFADITQFPAAYVAAHYDTSFTITVHANDIYREPIGAYTGPLLRSADRIVTISSANQQYLKDRFVEATPIDIVRAGIRPEKFDLPDKSINNRILSVARLVEKKGIADALAAFPTILAQLPDATYHVVGTGRQQATLQRQARALGVADRVEFLGTVDDKTLRRELAEAQCFLLPCVIAESGDRDGIPVALMEAMAAGVPPVSTRISGIPELITHDENGLLVEPRDPAAIATEVIRLLTRTTARHSLARGAQETVATRFNIATEANALEGVFASAQNKR
ncbi:glycosyltransferase family 4 protein [Halalkalirubrum salinum]|uniref:glycosyltransferase family 4 protein n=1 Tax=Halalkalirubrum salinum TaxID=2563889 RepID=UPI0010FB4773|nr:glycosyltransferase family 4 protein [Halalkalirubrum salinum]